MNEYEFLESDSASDNLSDTFDEDYFATFYLDAIFNLYHQLIGRPFHDPNILGKSNITSFTSLVLTSLFDSTKLIQRYKSNLSYRQNRFLSDNLSSVQKIVDSIYGFLKMISLKHNLHNMIDKFVLTKWVIYSSHI